LELSAKAAGITDADFHGPIEGMWSESLFDYWNPLTDDGDALRLSVKLNMQIWHNTGGTVSAMPPNEAIGFWNRLKDDLEPDPYAATRRAIVRAAAEIGKSMQ
jgi:hypothetical protein